MKIKGLLEKLGLTEEEEAKYKKMRIDAAMQSLMLHMNVVSRGGNMHGVDEVGTARRRRQNKAARKARKVNRGK